MIRIVKLYKHASTALEKKEVDEDDMDFDENVQEEEEIQAPDESKVGKKLSDLTTRRVIILVLSMMFSVPFLALDSYRDPNNSFTFGLEYIDIYKDDPTTLNFTRLSYIEEHTY